ncbi:MAG: radical SAM protein [Chloroflexi bacterium]|nr:radical SAM protein [Chloroflexota bacterium]
MNMIRLSRAWLLKDRPVYVHYGLTHRCNLRCKMCSLWQEQREELDLLRIEKLAVNLASLGCIYVSIGGGEPALREDLPQIIKVFTGRGIRARVLTNGIDLPFEKFEKILEQGKTDISVSLDSLDPEKVSDICGRKDAFEKIQETLGFLSPILKKTGGSGLINCVVSSVNLEELPSLAEFASGYGFSISFVPLERQVFGGKELACRDGMEEMFTGPENEKAVTGIYNELIRLKKSGGAVFNSTRFLELCRDALLGKTVSWDCRAGRLFFSIDPEGNFSVCHRFRGYGESPHAVPAWNEDFPKLFMGRELQKESANRVRGCPGCLRPCWAEIGLAFTSPKAAFERLIGGALK